MIKQRGVTLGGLLIFLVLASFFAYAGSRILPVYMDYWLVKRELQNLAVQPNVQNITDESIREQFAKQLHFNRITLATRSDLLIERIHSGVRLSAALSAKRPFIGPVNLCMEFQAEAVTGE